MQKKLIIPALIAGLIMAAAVNAAAYSEDTRDIAQCVLRLHVIANSDSETDQNIKLEVRDAILEYAREQKFNASDKGTYIAEVYSRLQEIEQVAHDTLRRLGSEEDVYAEIAKTYFPTRTYGDITLPAGEYDALRIVIGEGRGQNWWCVMFPPLCSNAVETAQAVEYLKENLDSGAFMMITEPEKNVKYELRLKIVDVINDIVEEVK